VFAEQTCLPVPVLHQRLFATLLDTPTCHSRGIRVRVGLHLHPLFQAPLQAGRRALSCARLSLVAIVTQRSTGGRTLRRSLTHPISCSNCYIYSYQAAEVLLLYHTMRSITYYCEYISKVRLQFFPSTIKPCRIGPSWSKGSELKAFFESPL